MELLVLLLVSCLILDIQSQNQKPRLSVSYDDQLDEFIFVCEIPKSVSETADLICNLYTGENPQPFKEQKSKKRKSEKGKSGRTICGFTAGRKEVFIRLGSVNKYEMSCDYSLESGWTARSQMSDKYTMTRFFPPQRPVPAETSPPNSFPKTQPTTEKSTTVFLFSSSVSTQLITTDHTTTHLTTVGFSSFSIPSPPQSSLSPSSSSSSSSSAAAAAENESISATSSLTSFTTRMKVTTRPITTLAPTVTVNNKNDTAVNDPKSQILMLSVVAMCVSLAGIISFGLCYFISDSERQRRKIDSTHGDQGVLTPMFKLNLSNLDSAGDYSVIDSVPSSFIPSESGGKENLKKTEGDVYHVYCTISDAVTSDGDAPVYSLVHAH